MSNAPYQNYHMIWFIYGSTDQIALNPKGYRVKVGTPFSKRQKHIGWRRENRSDSIRMKGLDHNNIYNSSSLERNPFISAESRVERRSGLFKMEETIICAVSILKALLILSIFPHKPNEAQLQASIRRDLVPSIHLVFHLSKLDQFQQPEINSYKSA